MLGWPTGADDASTIGRSPPSSVAVRASDAAAAAPRAADRRGPQRDRLAGLRGCVNRGDRAHGGVTRPVIYDHFQNLGRLLQALIEREERYALEQLAVVVQTRPGRAIRLSCSPEEFGAFSTPSRPGRDVADHPVAARGDAAIVREHVEATEPGSAAHRGAVRWAIECSGIPADLYVELGARTIRCLSEEAGRMLLTDSEQYSPERYERFRGP